MQYNKTLAILKKTFRLTAFDKRLSEINKYKVNKEAMYSFSHDARFIHVNVLPHA